MADTPSNADVPAPAISDALHTTLDMSFEDGIPYVQVEHELAGFETVTRTRLDRMVRGALDEEIPRTALLIVCHAEVARDVLAIDPTLAGLLPCTTVIYETPTDDVIHVHHISAGKTIRDLDSVPDTDDAEALVDLTAELMTEVWRHLDTTAAE